MLWRASTQPWRYIARSRYLHNTARRQLEDVEYKHRVPASKQGTATTIPKRSPPHVRHARLLGDGKPYHSSQLESEVKVTGLIRSIRKQKQVAFAHLSDGTTYTPIQAILPPGLAQNITNGSYVELLGKWQQSPGSGQSHELQVTSVPLVGASNPDDNPIQKQSMPADYLRGVPHLRIRTPFQSLLTRARSRVLYSITEFFENARRQPVLQVNPPIITSSDCEGAGEVFTISPRSSHPSPGSSTDKSKSEQQLYFREPKYLTVSSQLHLEAYCAELGDVWTLTPTFRAEESDTSRHLAEFYMLEAEFRGSTRLEGISGRVQDLTRWISRNLRDHRTGRELLEYYADRKHRPVDSNVIDLEERWRRLESDYKVITYSDAMVELEKAQQSHGGKLFNFQPKWTTGLQLEHERWIVDNIGNGIPTFVTHYPQSIKPFYMLPSADSTSGDLKQSEMSDNATVACFDLLLPYGYCEVAGGSLREHRLLQLIQSMRGKGLLQSNQHPTESNYPHLQPGENLGSLQWYADLRRYGSSPHGGFGLGFDRLLAYLTGVSNVRDVVGFPRSWGRADC